MRIYTWDLETYINCFLFIGKWEGTSQVDVFEISEFQNDRNALVAHLRYLQDNNTLMQGFNNVGFDYPICHELMLNPFTFSFTKAYNLGQQIIQSRGGFGDNRSLGVYYRERLIMQLDLYKINHFDNLAKSTRLKDLQFVMRSAQLVDLPYSPHSPLTREQIQHLRTYGTHDVTETEEFGRRCKAQIKLRFDLLEQGVLDGDVLNYSDVKIGIEYLIKRIGRSKCYVSGNKPRQTMRHAIALGSVILPKIFYRSEKYNAVKEWFTQQTIVMSSEDERPKLEAKLAGLQFHFGVGGVHASVENRTYRTSDTHIIRDIDVAGMYVAVAIANGFYPEHLGQDFVNAYKGLQSDRKQHAKGSAMNATLKLAGNGAFGNAGNGYSPMYDPRYLYQITVNGQLQLLQLIEVLTAIPGLQLIQANTDGITAYVPREHNHLFDLWCRDWENETGLILENVEYSAMFISDVNNYVAVKTNGEVKLKGKYWYPKKPEDYDGAWNKDFSNMSLQKCAEQALLHGHDPKHLVRLITDPFDFMLRYKTKGDATVYIGEQPATRTVRYYVSTAGQPMKKVSSPKGTIGDYKRRNGITDSVYKQVFKEIAHGTWDERIHTKNKSKYEQVETGIETGWLVKECNDIRNFNWKDVDFDYYEKEIRKLII